MYSIYLLLCEGDCIYTGIAKDVASRFDKHLSGKGAKFTRSHPPLRLLASAKVGNQSQALKMEHFVKRLPKNRKLAFVQSIHAADGVL